MEEALSTDKPQNKQKGKKKKVSKPSDTLAQHHHKALSKNMKTKPLSHGDEQTFHISGQNAAAISNGSCCENYQDNSVGRGGRGERDNLEVTTEAK